MDRETAENLAMKHLIADAELVSDLCRKIIAINQMIEFMSEGFEKSKDHGYKKMEATPAYKDLFNGEITHQTLAGLKSNRMLLYVKLINKASGILHGTDSIHELKDLD